MEEDPRLDEPAVDTQAETSEFSARASAVSALIRRLAAGQSFVVSRRERLGVGLAMVDDSRH